MWSPLATYSIGSDWGVATVHVKRLSGHGRSVTWHPEQMDVWCSTPRAATVSSGTTFVRINSAPQAVQRITRT
jgi:hypothetical protein